MTSRPPPDLEAENAYLRMRVAQLENDVVDLSAQVIRAQQQAERRLNRSVPAEPNPLSGGQSF
ncbi:hypothetical protein [Brevundimonas goettingensis]|uniref:Uncharacterized protein n=1 Tax=Brevundimonas goettingensis TaxID=2774190 RepID=A0A975C1M5_9CAUL|nr:hypothetical protein [Brevundimonas goettingensis]QTC92238.1 hypothetical protein IFJ75_04885 [Brevundimonas goettingensis]